MTKRRRPQPPPRPAPAPPPLVVMAAHKEQIEAQRQALWDVLFVPLRTALLETAGNVTHAGERLGMTRDRANYLCRLFGLAPWAAGLRLATMGRSMGRPKGSKADG